MKCPVLATGTRTAARGLVILLGLAVMLLPSGSARAATYRMTEGAYNGTRQAASDMLANHPNCGFTVNELAAVMLAIPVHEIAGGDSSVASSPMTLSRYDGWSNTRNRPLYSDGTYDYFRRAHWNPGVGLWQLDTFDDTQKYSHAIRMGTGGAAAREVGNYLREAKCNGSLGVALRNTWFACAYNMCWDTYQDMYVASDDRINKDLTPGTEYDEGVKDATCRFDPDYASFACNMIDVDNNAEGYAPTGDPTGEGDRTPLADRFYSFTRNDLKQAIWLRSGTGYDEERAKKVPVNNDAREVGNWSQSTGLQHFECYPGEPCGWYN
jgi:hypothetical protein